MNLKKSDSFFFAILAALIYAHTASATTLTSGTRVSEIHAQHQAANKRAMNGYVNRILAASNPFDEEAVYQTATKLMQLTPPFVLPLSKEPPTELIKAHEEAYRLYESGDMEGAIARLSLLAAANPGSVTTHFHLGLSLLTAGRVEEAKDAFKTTIRNEPWDWLSWLYLAVIFAEEEKKELALSAFMQAYEWSDDKSAVTAELESGIQDSESEYVRDIYESVFPLIERREAYLKTVREEYETYRMEHGESESKHQAKDKPQVDFSTCRKPDYPRSALVLDHQGAVELAFFVAKDGKVLKSLVTTSSGSTHLDNAARIALGSCRFSSARRDGVSEDTWTSVQYIWRLE
ncbi:MAG TPA: TonB family protein [Paucimonas sp.]|nr:TonB family protein [Paucimonas sp.]